MRKILTPKEKADIQQPLSKDGLTNPNFDKIYGKEKNPFTGTDRDRNSKSFSVRITKKDHDRIFKK